MTFKIPLFELNYDKNEETAILQTMQSKWISTGPKCEEFEYKFASLINSKYGLTTSSCTSALHLAVRTLDIGFGDEVIVPSLTFAATANCVTYVGATPVFADVTSLEDLTISPLDIRKKITSKTKAIIVMHFAGFACNMDEIMAIAAENNLYVIEDACHAPLSEYKGKKLGSIGDISCYSFFSNKNMSTGEGGMFVSNKRDFYSHAKLLRSHGMTTMSYQRAKGHATEYDINEIGFNYRMDDMRAAIGIVQLQKLNRDLERRAEVRDMYIKALANITGIIIPFQHSCNFSSNYIFPIILKDSNKSKRDMLRNSMHNLGIQTSIHYPSVHKFSCHNSVKLPITEYVSDNEITLPMYSSLTIENIDEISQALIKSLKK